MYRIFVLVLGLAATLFAPPLGSTDGHVCRDDIVLVFDASGSMGQPVAEEGAGLLRNRIDVARAALIQVAPQATTNRRSALLAYGPYGACEVQTILPLGQHSGSTLIANAASLRASGFTPLTLGVRRASGVLAARGGTIVLITDGIESCRENPCAAARQIAEQKPRVTVHVIGYLLGPTQGSDVACLAHETGGTYVGAQSFGDLARALAEAVGCPRMSAAPPRRHVARG
jgi:Ca-activated chloride channel family protein